ncbi:hypothetical protein ES703_64228 [subsurface metagenome]
MLISLIMRKFLSQSLGSRPMEFKSFGVAIKYGSFGSPVPPLYLPGEGAANEIKNITKKICAILLLIWAIRKHQVPSLAGFS